MQYKIVKLFTSKHWCDSPWDMSDIARLATHSTSSEVFCITRVIYS